MWIQRRGGRGLMAACSAAGGLALVMMGTLTGRLGYFAAWLLLGAAMAGLLYDAAFAVVTRAFGASYRRGITLITLVGGLASTVFIPLAQLAVDQLGWQRALVALGVTQFIIGVPLHALGIPRFTSMADPSGDRPTSLVWRSWWKEFQRDITDARFIGVAIWFTAHAAAFTGLIFQLVPILQALRVDNRTIIQAIAIIGPLQVLGRLFLTTRGNSFSTLSVGRWAMGALGAALLLVLVAPATFPVLALFAALFGAGNGMLTIVRGTAIAELFGRDRYAELNGALSAPAVLAKAAAPLVMAALWSWSGEPRLVFAAVLSLVGIGLVGLWIANAAARRLGRSTQPA
jgi:hypothetical protein